MNIDEILQKAHIFQKFAQGVGFSPELTDKLAIATQKGVDAWGKTNLDLMRKSFVQLVKMNLEIAPLLKGTTEISFAVQEYFTVVAEYVIPAYDRSFLFKPIQVGKIFVTQNNNKVELQGKAFEAVKSWAQLYAMSKSPSADVLKQLLPLKPDVAKEIANKSGEMGPVGGMAQVKITNIVL